MVRWVLTRGLVGLVCLLALGGSLDPAYAKGKKRAPRPDRYASIVVDANSDDILYTRQADTLRYPASLTKMMTLYMTFEALESGELALDQVLTASSRAARQAPSKLELRTDDKILVDDAIRAVVTKSANDAAVVLAEQIGGSEKEFARLMTEKAHALGMSRTTFKNASGLPNPGQRTTARDLATLGIALKRDFPQYFTYFATPNFTWAGVTYPNHNKLLTQYEGTTGLKTGYTSASGFNLAASVSREGHDLVAVVLGGRSARARDQHMMQLLDVQFARLKSGGPLVADAGPAPASPPDPKARLPAADSVPKSRAVVVAQAGANPRPRPDAGKAVQPALVASADPIGDTIAALTEGTTQGAPIEIGQGDTDDEDPKPTLDSRDASVIDWLGGNQAWGIQIGAFVAMESAAARLSAASALAPDYLAKATPAILPAANGSSTLYRARFGPFDETQAQAACEALSRRGITCQTVHDTN